MRIPPQLPLVLVVALQASCGRPQRIPDPDSAWMLDYALRSFVNKSEGSLVLTKAPPFHTMQWRFGGVGGSYVSAMLDPGCCVYFRIDKPPYDFEEPEDFEEAEDFEILLHPRSIGDVGDIYYRVNGQRGSKLRGELTEFYKQSLRDMVEYAEILRTERK